MGSEPTIRSEAPANSKPEKPGFFSYENLKSLFILVVVIFAIRWSVASPYHVPTASMEPTIKVGDRLLAWKLSYNLKFPFTDFVLAEWGQPQRADIIVFRFPDNPDIDYVKRVVGLPGDKVEVIDDIIYVNGEKQPRIDHDRERTILTDIHDPANIKHLYVETLGSVNHWTMQNLPEHRPFIPRNFGPITVEENHVFVMGDNRDNSTDSRVWGQVPMENVRGKALFVIWSIYTPQGETWPTLRLNRIGHSLYDEPTIQSESSAQGDGA